MWDPQDNLSEMLDLEPLQNTFHLKIWKSVAENVDGVENTLDFNKMVPHIFVSDWLEQIYTGCSTSSMTGFAG